MQGEFFKFCLQYLFTILALIKYNFCTGTRTLLVCLYLDCFPLLFRGGVVAKDRATCYMWRSRQGPQNIWQRRGTAYSCFFLVSLCMFCVKSLFRNKAAACALETVVSGLTPVVVGTVGIIKLVNTN